MNLERADPEGFRFDSELDVTLVTRVLARSLSDMSAYSDLNEMLDSVADWNEIIKSLVRRDSVVGAERALAAWRESDAGEDRVALLVLQSLIPGTHWARAAAQSYCDRWFAEEPDALDGDLPMLMGTLGLSLPTRWLLGRSGSADPNLRREALSAIWSQMVSRATAGSNYMDGSYEFDSDPGLPAVLSAVADPDGSVRLHAASLVAACTSVRRSAPRVRAALLPLIADPAEDIRAVALSGLCMIHEPGIAPHVREELEAVLAGPDRRSKGRRLGPGQIMSLAEAVDSVGDLTLMPLMEAIDARWNIADQDYLDAYGLRWRFNSDRVSRMLSGLADERAHVRWDALNDLSVFDADDAASRIVEELPAFIGHREFENCTYHMCEAISRMRSASFLPALRQLRTAMYGSEPPIDRKYLLDVDHLISICGDDGD